MIIKINELMASSGVQFGTSGVRGLVKDMTDQVCFSYVMSFLQYLQQAKLIVAGSQVGIAGDLRSSTPSIMNAVAAACIDMGFEPVNYGYIPSPAIALYGLKQQIPTIMVTGSHIPDDRNGMKFNTPLGEILKQEEEGIRAQQLELPEAKFSHTGQLQQHDYLPKLDNSAEEHYIQRFIDFLPTDCLQGKDIGLYEHSSVSRTCLNIILQQLGANVTSLGRSEQFISVDTEAIRPEDTILAKEWSDKYQFDCIISTDGDGDRPLVSDEKGNWLRGDIVGFLCAHYLGADTVITPVSSNSVIEESHFFKHIIRTKIGSPYVIEAMQKEAQDKHKKVVGYEANGGFLQQTTLMNEKSTLSTLATRDAAIVPLAVLLLAQDKQLTISELVNTLPQRYTFSDRLKDFPTQLSQQILAKMVSGDDAANYRNIQTYFPSLSLPININTIDGVRISFSNGDIVHLRPSGNAPELRCYTESYTELRAKELNNSCIKIMKGWS